MNYFDKLILEPKLLVLGFLIAVLFDITPLKNHFNIFLDIRIRQRILVSILIILLLPVYIQNSRFFSISPDSQGFLRSPDGSTTYRPPLLWMIYRIFVSQKEIDEFFQTNPKPGIEQRYTGLLAGSNLILILYLFSIIFLLWTFYKYLHVKGNLLVIAILVQTSGPLYFLPNYYFLPEKLIPVYRLTLYFLLFHLLITQMRMALVDRTRRKAIERFVISCSGLMLLLISARSALLVDELNQIMTETLTSALINVTVGLSVIIICLQKSHQLKLAVFLTGIASGLLCLLKLSMILTPGIFLVIVLLLKVSGKEKMILSCTLILAASIPAAGVTLSKSASETSQAWYGLVSYAIEFHKEKPRNLELSKDAELLLEAAIQKRDEAWMEYPDTVSQYKFIYQKTPIALYYGALPAAYELGFTQKNSDYVSDLFKEITLAVFSVNKDLAAKALLENLRVPLGIFKFEGEYMTLSKIVKNPFVYLLFIPLLLSYRSVSTFRHSVVILLMFSYLLSNYFVVSVFNGPLARYFYLYDPLVLYIVVILISTTLLGSAKNRVRR